MSRVYPTGGQEVAVGGGGSTDVELIRGLDFRHNSGSSLIVSPGECYIPGIAEVVSCNVDTAFGPAFGSASTWYHLYLYKTGPGAFGVNWGTALPVRYGFRAAYATGDNTRRYIGSVLTNASGSIYSYTTRVMASNEITLDWTELNNVAPFRVLAGGNNTSATVIDLSGIVPPAQYLRYNFLCHLVMGANDVINAGIGPVINFSAWYAAQFKARGDARMGNLASVGWAIPGEVSLIARETKYVTGYIAASSITLDSAGFTVMR